GGMRDRHGVDEMLLEAGLDRRLDLFDGAHDPLDLVASLAREQRDERAGPGRVASRADAVQRRIWHEPEHEGMQRIDLAPERARELDPIDGLDAANPVSSDQRLEPMTRKRGSRVSLSTRTRSIAPGAARWPLEIWAPSKAGPVGDEAASSRSRLPRTISAFVPTSTSSVISS